MGFLGAVFPQSQNDTPLARLISLARTRTQPVDSTGTPSSATIPALPVPPMPVAAPQPMTRLPSPDTPPPVTMAGLGGGMPSLPFPGAPAVASAAMPKLPDPAVANTASRLAMDQGELRRLTSSGSGLHQITNPVDVNGNPPGAPVSGLRRFAGTLARIGATAEGIVAPGAAAVTPGTDQNHERLLREQTGMVNNDLANQQEQANTTLLNAQPQLKQLAAENAFMKTQGLLGHYQDQGQHYTDQNASTLHDHGYTIDESDPNGQKIRPLRYDEMSEGQQAVEDLRHSQSDVADATAALKKAQSDPNSPAYRMAAQKLAVSQQNAGAAQLRAKAYWGRYQQNAYNVGLNGEVLPGAPQIQDAGGGVTTVGTANATQAVKAQANVAKMNDVHGALDNIENSAKALVQSGGSLNSPGLIYAMQHSQGTPSEFVQSLDKANLSPQERQYVMSVAAGHENIQALRGSLGAGVTDSQINRLDSMIPSGSTPDLNYLLGQTSQIRQTADRLAPGVTTVKGGLGVRGQTANNPPGIQAFTDGGVTYHIPAGQVAEFRKDHPNAR